MKSLTGYRRSKESLLEYKREYYRKWRNNNRDKVNKAAAAWRSRNLDKSRAQNRKWKKENPARHAAINMKRKAAKLQRTVAWADDTKIQSIYDEATRLTKETKMLHHVDHIIPLQGNLVSGLHVETNLQILLAENNMSKGNKFNG